MAKYLIKWILASLVMPVLVVISKGIPDDLVLLFWPGSIVLMSLGAEPSSTSRVVGVWGAAVFSNIVLYLVLGLVTYCIYRFSKRSSNKSAKAP
jgi:putative effector of murein hydrolase LrgA (UPF0299 family)